MKVSSHTFGMEQSFIDNLSYSNTVTVQAMHVHIPSLKEINVCLDNLESKCNDSVQRHWSRPGLVELVKTYESSSFNIDEPQMVGSRVLYEFTVRNIGDMTVTALEIVDDILDEGPGCNSRTLTPTASTYCWSHYSLTQADIDAGHISSTASAHAVLLKDDKIKTPVAQSSLNLSLVQAPKLTVEKTSVLNIDDGEGSGSVVNVGDTIDFHVEVTNAGNVQFPRVLLQDKMSRIANGNVIEDDINGAIQPCGGILAADGSEMRPGDMVTCSYSYSITQDDVDAGGWTNTAKITSADFATGQVCTAPHECSATTSGDWAVKVTGKISKHHGFITPQPNVPLGPTAGSTIVISYLLENTGITTITTINVKDEKVYSGDICSVALLPPGENTECNLEYTITQDDIEAGFKDGIAEFWGKAKHYVEGVLKIDEDADSSVLLDQTPLLHIERSLLTFYDISSDKSQRRANYKLSFHAIIHNKGNVNLYNIVLTESLGVGAKMNDGCVRDPKNFLAPGDSFVCNYTYDLTQGDVDAQQWSSTLNGSAESLSGSNACNIIIGTGYTCHDMKEDNWINHMNITLVTTHDYPLEHTFPSTTHEILYSFHVENTGYGTVTDLLVNDPMMVAASVNIECNDTVIVPGAKVVCSSGPYRVTEKTLKNNVLKVKLWLNRRGLGR